jgi:hypothetical protein
MAKKTLFKSPLCLAYCFFYKEEIPLLYFIKSIVFTNNQQIVSNFYSCSRVQFSLLKLLILCFILFNMTLRYRSVSLIFSGGFLPTGLIGLGSLAFTDLIVRGLSLGGAPVLSVLVLLDNIFT